MLFATSALCNDWEDRKIQEEVDRQIQMEKDKQELRDRGDKPGSLWESNWTPKSLN